LFVTVASAMRAGIVANLIPASGDQDHTTWPSAVTALVSCRCRVHRIPRPTFVTIAKRPSFRVRNGPIEASDLPDCANKIFFAQELDSPNRFESPSETGFCAQADFGAFRLGKHLSQRRMPHE